MLPDGSEAEDRQLPRLAPKPGRPATLASAGAVSTWAVGVWSSRKRTRSYRGVGAGSTILPTTRIGHCILTLSVPPSR